MERYHQPRIGPDRRVRQRRAGRPAPDPAPRRAPVRLGAPAMIAIALALAGLAFIHWTRTASSGTPLDRAGAVCRSLAHSPHDTLAAGIEAEVELRRGPFATAAPALARALGADSTRVLRHWTQRVGDYQVAALWVRLPDDDRHALAVGWLEGRDLALCRFRFPGHGAFLTAGEIARGDDLLDRVLVPRNFRVRG